MPPISSGPGSRSGLYLDPPESAVVQSVDEKAQVDAARGVTDP